MSKLIQFLFHNLIAKTISSLLARPEMLLFQKMKRKDYPKVNKISEPKEFLK